MKTPQPIKYIHEESTHNLLSPSKIVPFIVKLLNPKSVIDVGCGIGTFLFKFKEVGVKEVVGVDGKWVDKQKLMISSHEFLETDLELPIQLKKEFDLALCLEVAEHLSENSADTLVNSLTGLSKVIVFSAAIEKQGGQNHMNEQNFSYWKKKFESKNYSVVDIFRPEFWNDTDIQWWYKQNMFLVIHNSIDKNLYQSNKKNLNENDQLIHPELYSERIKDLEHKMDELSKIKTGKGGNLFYYIGLLLRNIKG
jgi:SAM-dependent methyltransferase